MGFVNLEKKTNPNLPIDNKIRISEYFLDFQILVNRCVEQISEITTSIIRDL